MVNCTVSLLLPCVAAFIVWMQCSIAHMNPKIQTKPHILFLVIDDLGWTDISAHRAEYQTQSIDNLINSGIELTNYYVHPVCSPTRSSLMTGQYSFKNGLQSLRTITPGSTVHIPFSNPTLPELLKQANYTTHMLGKWHLGYAAWNMTPTGRGFDTHFGYFQGAEDYYNYTIDGGFDFWLNKNVLQNVSGSYSTGLYNQYMNRLLDDYTRSNNPNPLFIYMAFQTVHTPIEISPNSYPECSHITDAHRKIYCNKIQYLDNVIANYVDLFKTHHLWDETLLILSTDNGGMPYWSDNFNSHPLAVSYGCNMPYRAGKATLFEGGVHGVAFINGGDDIIPDSLRGTQRDVLSHVIDWTPTIIGGVLNRSLPDNVAFDGENMWNAWMNPKDNELSQRNTLYLDIEQNGSFAGIRDGDYKYFQGKQLYTAYFPCNGSYIPYDNTSEAITEWLFNLKTDPYESNNIAQSNPELVRKYKVMIEDFVVNGGYVPEQDSRYHPESSPKLHGGVWHPWLS